MDAASLRRALRSLRASPSLRVQVRGARATVPEFTIMNVHGQYLVWQRGHIHPRTYPTSQAVVLFLDGTYAGRRFSVTDVTGRTRTTAAWP